jgi:hypothetical protein
MDTNDYTEALLAIQAMGEAEIKRGDYRDADDFLRELEGDDALGELSED